MSGDPWILAVVVFVVFAATLVLAALLSALAARSILSAAILFLVVGFLCGPAALAIFQPPCS